MYTENRPGPARTGVWVVLKGEKYVGKIIAAYPNDGAGALHLTMWDWTDSQNSICKSGRASGYGFDKVAHIMSSFKFGGKEIKEGAWAKSIEDNGYTVIQAL